MSDPDLSTSHIGIGIGIGVGVRVGVGIRIGVGIGIGICISFFNRCVRFSCTLWPVIQRLRMIQAFMFLHV